MTTKSLVGLFGKIKGREQIPRIEGDLEGKAPTKKPLGRKSGFAAKASEMVRLRKAGKWNELTAISVVSSYAELIVRIEAEQSGGTANLVRRSWLERVCAPQLASLSRKLSDLKIPVALYLRVHARMRLPLRIECLVTDRAVNEFSDWLETEGRSLFQCEEDFREWISQMSEDASDDLSSLLIEWQKGADHLARMCEGGSIMDPDLAELVEMPVLPGGYLVTSKTVMDAYRGGSVGGEVAKRISQALGRLKDPDTRTRFYREVESRRRNGL
jgi:hypothetical protein